MVRACRPPEREPVRSWLARRSTIATSTSANANSPANISPVGPPPAITTACPVTATLRPPSRPRGPAARTPAPPRRVPVTGPRVPPAARRPGASHVSTTRHALAAPVFRRFWSRPAILRHDPGLAASPPVRYTLKVARSGYSPSPISSAVDGPPPREAAARRVRRYRRPRRISDGLTTEFSVAVDGIRPRAGRHDQACVGGSGDDAGRPGEAIRTSSCWLTNWPARADGLAGTAWRCRTASTLGGWTAAVGSAGAARVRW